jgi:hypothetical protein
MNRAVALLIVSYAGFMAVSTQAQELQSLCLQQVEDLCGSGSVSQCFADESMWDLVYNECTGDIQTLVEMDREANAEQGSTSSNGGSYRADTGFSYGGVLRSGPGSNYRRLASLVDGDDVEIIGPTGEWSDGYQWYQVNSRFGAGFHWGGIFCSQEALEGVLTTCSEGY